MKGAGILAEDGHPFWKAVEALRLAEGDMAAAK